MIPAIFFKDFYKAGHIAQYPKGTELIYSNFTPRSSVHSTVPGNDVVVFGIQHLILKYLIDEFNATFFDRDKGQIVAEYKSVMDSCLGPDSIPVDHIEALHDLGYLPIHIKALPEGTLCPIGVPMLTIKNTKPEFFWVTNMLETLLSTVLWQPITSATTAYRYKLLINKYAEETGADKEMTIWQGHDFSMRGMPGIDAACASSAGHLLSFAGTDTIPAILWLEHYYYADSELELVGGSVPATEHSVMCMGTQGDELGTFKTLITETYPDGIISIVSDTWDFWKVVTEYLPALKQEIMARDGKVVIRPDSGDPVDIICGQMLTPTLHEQKGLIECLWDTFGGTVNEFGYKVLDDRIGAIYGDSITYDRAQTILARLKAKGFASTNIVFGIGSYTYQHVTRDSHGFALKATYGEVNGKGREIFKDPKTDSGLKKSARGLLKVERVDGAHGSTLVLKDQCCWEEEREGELRTVFHDGQMIKSCDLGEIRARLGVFG